MRTRAQKILSRLPALSALASLTALNGDPVWLAFLCFLSFLGFRKVKPDERWEINLDRAARNGFIVSFLCMVAMFFLLVIEPQLNILTNALKITFAAMIVSFVVSFMFYEKKGE